MGQVKPGDRVRTVYLGRKALGEVIARDPGEHGERQMGVTIRLDNGVAVRRKEGTLRWAAHPQRRI